LGLNLYQDPNLDSDFPDDFFVTFFRNKEKIIPGCGFEQPYPPETIILHQGRPVHAAYLITCGLVKLNYIEPKGREIIVGIRNRYWLLGVTSVLLERPYPFIATTLINCTLRGISENTFLNLMETDRIFNRHVTQMLCRDIRSDLCKVIEVSVLPCHDRLIRFLAQFLLELEPENLVSEIQIPLKEHELADVIGVTPQHLSRVLQSLEDQDILRRGKRRLFITHPETLLSQANT
jgi:CRP/FNR family transcriptional regulator